MTARGLAMRLLAACIALALLACMPSRAHAQRAADTPPPEYAAVSAGERYTCALAADGRAFCWGADWYGQLGAGGVATRCDESIYAKGACSRTAVEVAGGHRFEKLHAADTHACAIDLAGAAWCWGNGHLGQLTRDHDALDRCMREPSRDHEDRMPVACSRVPVRIPLPAAAVAIDGGAHMTCALDANGAAWCWAWRGGAPRRIPLDRPLTTLAAGGTRACGLTGRGGIRCWDLMELERDGVQAPTRLENFVALDVGTEHACALDSGGTAYCWGRDVDAALGIGPNPHSSFDELPFTAVVGGHRFGSIVTGAAATCATDAGNRLWCWGRVPESATRANDRCLDTNGIWRSNDCINRPVLVHPEMRFGLVAIGSSHRCGVSSRSGQRLVCWGENEAGQLGDGTTRDSHAPTAVRFVPLGAAEARMADVRAGMGTLLSRGGLALLVVVALIVAARDRIARWGMPELGAIALGGLVMYTLAVVVGPQVTDVPADTLRRTAKLQLLVLVAGLGTYRFALAAHAWWRSGVKSSTPPAPSRPAATAAALPDDGRKRGTIALGTVLSGWVLLAWATFSITSEMSGPNRPRGEVAGGIAMFALFLVALMTVGLALAGGTIATLRLRRHRDDRMALVALVLGALTVAAALAGWAWLAWPREY